MKHSRPSITPLLLLFACGDAQPEPSPFVTGTESEGGGESTGELCPEGELGCPCYGNDTCNAGLACDAGECVESLCGDGQRQGDEECDDGNDDDTDNCPTNCLTARCGDGFVRASSEECDDGNDVDDDACTNACSLPQCGDGIVQENEECDVMSPDPAGCTPECLDPVCGDGFLYEDAEECDDGNDIETDECLSTCAWAVCGDGAVLEDVEECDDGNDVATDDCLPECILAACGDGFVHEGVEECDDANAADNDDCLTTCVLATCGDGFVQDGVEECDGSNFAGNDCTTQGYDWTDGDLDCQRSCTTDTSDCYSVLDNTNGVCALSVYCLENGPHAQQECFVGLTLPQPLVITEVSYNMWGYDDPSMASLEIYTWNGTGPGTLLTSEPLTLADLTVGAHSIQLSTPLEIDDDSFCAGLRADGMFSLSRDGTTGNTSESFIEAPNCSAPVFVDISATAMTGNFCVRPTVIQPPP